MQSFKLKPRLQFKPTYQKFILLVIGLIYYTEPMPVLQHHEILLLVHLSPVLLQDRVHLLVLIVAETLPTWNPEMLISTYVD